MFVLALLPVGVGEASVLAFVLRLLDDPFRKGPSLLILVSSIFCCDREFGGLDGPTAARRTLSAIRVTTATESSSSKTIDPTSPREID